MTFRKPEFHLYLYSMEGYKKDVINANTVSECHERVNAKKDVDTYQVIACTTSLFNDDYRIFIHPSPMENYEIRLGTCPLFGNRELRMGHNLPNLILSYLV